MNLVNAIQNQPAYTENGMPARKSTANACVDLFSSIGASRGKNIIPQFMAAYVENREIALRIMLWARDIRGGAGERQLFKDVLISNLPTYDSALLASKIPELGRWDDLLIFVDTPLEGRAFATIGAALKRGNTLCAKWMPRKGRVAAKLRKYLKLSPKAYRKLLVSLTDVVETQMCSNNWDEINYEHVPSLASARYKKAFERHGHSFSAYVEKLAKGEAKVNAAAVYPHDVIKTIVPNPWGLKSQASETELNHIIAQWKALPDYMSDAKIFPMIDVSSSMDIGSSNVRPVDVAIALGLYVADKNKGVLKDAYLTFSRVPKIKVAKGNIVQKVQQLDRRFAENTDLEAALKLLLVTAINGNVSQDDMPSTLVIFSDMQFDYCMGKPSDTAIQAIRRNYEAAGYQAPNIVFWNLRATDNVPVHFNEQGVALVSGFSPAIMKSVLQADPGNFTPYGMMLSTVMSDRYSLD